MRLLTIFTAMFTLGKNGIRIEPFVTGRNCPARTPHAKAFPRTSYIFALPKGKQFTRWMVIALLVTLFSGERFTALEETIIEWALFILRPQLVKVRSVISEFRGSCWCGRWEGLLNFHFVGIESIMI